MTDRNSDDDNDSFLLTVIMQKLSQSAVTRKDVMQSSISTSDGLEASYVTYYCCHCVAFHVCVVCVCVSRA